MSSGHWHNIRLACNKRTLPIWLVLPLCSRLAGRQHLLTLVMAWLCNSLILLLIKIDQTIYDLYAFHINRFVLNLLFTPGGISSLGSSAHTYYSSALIVLQIVGIQLLLLFISNYGVLFCLRYPLEPVTFSTKSSPPNIIILVAESLRWDQLNEEIMPNTWHFGAQNQRFTQHYSSGNGTREGLFGMFYGLYGSYWESYMHARQSPLLMDRIQALNYQLDIRTSATFTYPEFDKTLFAHVPEQAMHTADGALPPWRRDELNTDELLAFLDQKDQNTPFMSFLFFESTHAGYSFPEESALYKPYESEMDYTRLSKASLAQNIDPLFNRYHNAAHWLDMQLGRIYQALEQKHLLEHTIVIVTGDQLRQ